MICDFNISYDEVSFGQRAALAVTHAANFPVHLIKTIIDLAKTIFFALVCTLTFYQSEIFNAQLKLSVLEYLTNMASIPLTAFGVFAPVNASVLQINAVRAFASTLS